MARMPVTRCTTTLFDLVAAVQESLTVDEEAAGLATTVVQDLLRNVVRRRTPRGLGAMPSDALSVARDAA
jgi:hypothetical protein